MKAFFDLDPLLKGMYWVQDAGACSGVYVLEEGRTLIDAGNMLGLVDELQDIGPIEGLERILLTHAHFDHVGGLQEIFQFVSPNLFVHPMTREYLRLLQSPFPEFFDALEADGKIVLIKDGDRIEGTTPLRVIHTPGHTAGDVCFFDDASGALFSGDTVIPHKHRAGNILSKPDERYGGRMQDKIESLRKLLVLPVCHLFPGHGDPVFQKGIDQIKLSLYAFYQAANEDFPGRAWVLMGEDLLDAGLIEDARQCALKAQQILPEDPQLRKLLEKIGYKA
jgi:glyoxylase-like metal-dependent hydrolase (beta-lactamase superfamily II)